MSVTSKYEARAFAVSPAMVSAFVFRRLPFWSCVNGAITGTTPSSISVANIRPSHASTSPTKPKSTICSVPSSIFTFFKGRLCDRITFMSAPVRPSALMPQACKRATMFLFTKPPYTIVTTRNISSSVTRRPPIMVLSIPNCDATFVAERPPPCTSTFAPSMALKSLSSCWSVSSSSTILPPTLITVTSFIYQ